MTFIFDHIIATIIVGTLFISLAATQLRVQEAGVAQVSSHAAKTKALTFGQWLDEDIVSLGENVVNNSARFDNPTVGTYTVYTCSGGSAVPNVVTYTSEWSFYSDRLLSGTVLQRQATRYRVVTQPDSLGVELDACDKDYKRPLFQLEREVSVWKNVDTATDTATFLSSDFGQDGRSVSTLSLFHVTLVDNQGDPFDPTDANAPGQASYIRVDFSMVPEFELRRGYLRELYWTTTLKVRPFWS